MRFLTPIIACDGMRAPQQFVDWLTSHEHKDPVYGWVYRYHSRSDAHSIALCQFVLKDLLAHCPAMRKDALANKIVYGINARHTFPNGKKKTLDLAIGTVGGDHGIYPFCKCHPGGKDQPRSSILRSQDRNDGTWQVATSRLRRAWFIPRDRSPGRPRSDSGGNHRGEHCPDVHLPIAAKK